MAIIPAPWMRSANPHPRLSQHEAMKKEEKGWPTASVLRSSKVILQHKSGATDQNVRNNIQERVDMSCGTSRATGRQ